jgi:hypothetical protein
VRAYAAAIACAGLLLQSASAIAATVPRVPDDIQAPADAKLIRIDHAVGTQNYICVPKTGGGFEWMPYGPQATLFSAHGRQTMTHFLSANPEEGGTLRPTWQYSKDTSAIWAEPWETSSDPEYVDPDAIPWLLLRVAGSQIGPTKGRRLTHVDYIQRINTTGGKAPATGCAEAGDVRKRELVPYTADYVFYKSTSRE